MTRYADLLAGARQQLSAATLIPPSDLPPLMRGEKPTQSRRLAAQAEGFRRIYAQIATGCPPEDLYGVAQFICHQMSERGA